MPHLHDVTATDDPATLAPADVVMIAVKGYRGRSRSSEAPVTTRHRRDVVRVASFGVQISRIGSSRERFARGNVAMEDIDRRRWVPGK